jgi:hypothetical protein
MDLDARMILAELQTLRAGDSASALPHLRELAGAIEQTMLVDRYSKAGIAAALTQQAIDYLYEGIEREQNRPEVNRRFAMAIKRAEAWVSAKETTLIFQPADDAASRGGSN